MTAPSTSAPPAARLWEINEAAADWFTAAAPTSTEFAAAARDRGHHPDLLTRLGVGLAPTQPWTGLTTHLRTAGFDDAELLASGLSREASSGRLYDTFRGRIMFPIHAGKRIAGFTARDITGDPTTPKYLNTPTTGVFNKAQLLYGTGQITPRTTGLVLVEGPWDALAVSAATRGTVIGLAACGTAVTADHLDAIRATGLPLCLCLDADQAGLRALDRITTDLTNRTGQHPVAVQLPPNTDPADLYRSGGPPRIITALQQAQPAGLVWANAELARHGLTPNSWAEHRVAAARSVAHAARGLTPNEQAAFAAIIATHTHLGGDSVTPLLPPPIPPPRPPLHTTTGPDPPGNIPGITFPQPSRATAATANRAQAKRAQATADNAQIPRTTAELG